MWEYFKAGGPVMWPLLAVSLLSLTVIFERVIFWVRLGRRRNQALVDQFLELAEKGDLEKAARIAQGTEDPVLRTLHCGLVHRNWSLTQAMAQQGVEEVRRMRRYLALLDTCITVAPLLGILGTVTGIIGAFQVVGGSGIPDPKAVTGGIAEALITTVFGLVIAIYSLFPFNYFGRWVNQAREDIEKYATSLEIIFQKKQTLLQPLWPVAENDEPVVGIRPGTKHAGTEKIGGLSEKEKRFFLS